MNTHIRKTLTALATAGLLLGLNSGAQAGEPLGQHVSAGVGQTIAAQGNAALEQIREDLRDHIEQTLQPLTPGPQGLADGREPDTAEHAA